MTSITISLVVIESKMIMLSSYIVDFLLICIITLCYLTLYADPQLTIAIFWSRKTIVLCGALRVKVTKIVFKCHGQSQKLCYCSITGNQMVTDDYFSDVNAF